MEQNPSDSPLIVVGIGASAGGLAALKTFFELVPDKTGLAFVVVVHLSPDHESHLAEVLQPHARIPVQQVNETIALERDRIYIIPPGSNLSSIDTHLRLSELPRNRRHRAPIDHFFRTLADSHDGKSVGVILTGSGADGTLGVKEIKAKNGIVLVQDPAEAEYDSMPASAASTGLADLVLPLREIPAAILRLVRAEGTLAVLKQSEDAQTDVAPLLHKLFLVLRARTGRDFSRYKQSTLLRRVARRMQLNNIPELANYIDHLREAPEEARALADDLLITVTSFFRNAEVFEKLQKDIVPQFFHDRDPDEDLRIWCAGCATGEEAYSLTMLVLEEAARHESAPSIQIFATDLHESSLYRGREGLYRGDIASDVGEERLKRFFQKEDSGYRIRRDIRELIVFAQHNVLSDPPFSRIDLISCRNLFIYLQREVQHDLIELFHYALRAGGFLVLGTSETVESSPFFTVEDKKHGIYKKRNVPPAELRLPVFTGASAPLRTAPRLTESRYTPVAYGAMHERMVERYAPPSVLVTPDDKIVHVSAHAGKYLVHPGGELTASAIKLVREELRVELRAALHEAKQKRAGTRSRAIMVRFNGESRPVVLDVRPATESQDEGFVLVLFDEHDVEAATPSSVPDAAASASEQHARVLQLTAELDLTRQRLRDLIEEYESTDEEMKASNEELQSSNEELRSTLEELETSKEEIQSVNEELQTVNQENRNRVEELAQLSADLQNLLAASEVATLFLDRNFHILRFTPQITKFFNIRAADQGRPITDLTHRLGYGDLTRDIEQVLDQLVPVERELQDATGSWYLTRLRPYRSSLDRIEGVVITFFDISERKRNEEALRESERQLAAELAAMKRLHDLVNKLLASNDVSSALDAVLRAAIEITEAAMGNVQLLDPASGTLKIVAQHGFSDDFLQRFREVSIEDATTCGRALKAGERVIIEDVQTDPLYEPYRDTAARAGYRAVQSTPLFSRDRELLGMLSTHYAEAGQPSERKLRILDLYSRQAAEFIEHVRSRHRMDEADKRKDEFLAMLGHELRNPVAAIRNSIELLKMKKLDNPDIAHFRDVIGRQTQNLSRLVADLLQLSRFSTGKIELQLMPVDLSALVESAVRESGPPGEVSRHDVALDLASPGPQVLGDPTRLTQVFTNLLNNARQYTPEGGEIRVSVKTEGRRAIVCVRDSGIGIPAEDLAKIFDFFYQAKRGRETRAPDSLGIGLALAKSLVVRHGGTIEARSSGEGQGSEFIVRLPVIEAASDARENDAANHRNASGMTARKILIVDDDADLAGSLSLLLRHSGYDVATAADGEEAVRVARSFRPEVVLLDLGLPKRDGYEVARQIRAEKWGKPMILIAHTGRGEGRDRQRWKDVGFNHFLTKPVELNELLKLIRAK